MDNNAYSKDVWAADNNKFSRMKTIFKSFNSRFVLKKTLDFDFDAYNVKILIPKKLNYIPLLVSSLFST